MLARLDELRRRLDALAQGNAPALGLLDRARARFNRVPALPRWEELTRLDGELERVGVHTAADARLLRQLSASRGSLAELAAGLSGRAQVVLAEYEERLELAERALALGEPLAGAASQLERAFPKLARAVKTAGIFDAPDAEASTFELFASPRSTSTPSPSARVEVARFFAERAEHNADDLFEKRRDLDSAHELLLRIGSSLDRDRVRELRLRVSDARARIHAVPAVRSLEDLVRHVKVTARKDPKTAYRSLRALYERAVEAQDAGLAAAAHEALRPLLPEAERLGPWVERAELEALKLEASPVPKADPSAEDLLAQVAFDLDDERRGLFELAAGCARFFDVEAALADPVVEAETQEHRPRAARVPYPTQRMNFELTGSLHEVGNFVLSDPRTLVYDLASNRQLVRTYLEDEPPRRSQRVKRTAVRVYVCDASGSMHGPRARFRDAILVAELNNLRVKALRGEPVDPLYFSFFNERPSELARVDGAAAATRHIERLFGDSPAEGSTQITGALVSAFDAIRAAAGKDPYLARATVVLITDGEDRIDVELVRATRAPVGSVDIALSFISLGEENPDLKALAEEQREKGARAFYHHLSDAEIGRARTDFDTRFRTLLPLDVPPTPDALERLLPHLEALEAIAHARAAPAAPPMDASFEAIFPPPPPGPDQPAPAGIPPEDLERIAEILDAITEAVSLAPAERRGGEAVTLLHHLLGVYGLPLPRYQVAVELAPPKIKVPLERLRLTSRPFG